MSVKLLGISGSPIKGGNTETLLRTAFSDVDGLEDVDTVILGLADLDISGCNHCNWCTRKQSEGRFCAQLDDMTVIYPELLSADGIVLATPVHFGRLSGSMANMIDRLRCFVHGNRYHGRLHNKVGGSLAVAFIRGGGVETTLTTLNSALHIFEMVVATSRMYQLGAAAFTSLDGKGRVSKGVGHMVLKDDFGVESARRLVERIVELARIMKAGQEVLYR